MKKQLLIAITLCSGFVQQIKGQDYGYEWTKTIGSTASEQSFSSIVDGAGNTYVTGIFQGTVDFDPGVGVDNHTSAGGYDSFVQKLDASGNLVWAKSFGGTQAVQARSISIGSSGDVYVVGYFQGTADFDPSISVDNHTSAGGNDSYVQKLDSLGNFVWAKSFGGTNHVYASSVNTDSVGNVYVVGYFSGTSDFDPGVGVDNHTSTGSRDVFVQKIDGLGNFIWAKSFGGTSNDFSESVAADASGNVYVTGYFQGTADLDPGTGVDNHTSLGVSDVFIQKLDVLGNLVWAKSFGGTSDDFSQSLVIDLQGNIYVTGAFQGVADLDPGSGINNHTSNGGIDAFVQKLDNLGNLIWVKSFGGPSDDYGTSLCVDGMKNVYTIGIYENTVDFDPGIGVNNHTSIGSYDVFIQNLDSLGDLLWVKSFGGSSTDIGSSISVHSVGEIHTSGHFNGVVDFNPAQGIDNHTSVGSYDVFAHKMSLCVPKNSIDTHTVCDSLTWIDGITYTMSNNTATHTLLGGAENGCDSIVTLDLTINTLDTSVSQNNNTLTANETSALYQWLDCDNGNAIISGETNQVFTASSNGNYAVEVTKNGCVDTSTCYTVSSVGIVKNKLLNNIKVFPNPTQQNFSIDLGLLTKQTKVEITELTGRIVFERFFENEQLINIELNQSVGIYILKITADNSQIITKLIKK